MRSAFHRLKTKAPPTRWNYMQRRRRTPHERRQNRTRLRLVAGRRGKAPSHTTLVPMQFKLLLPIPVVESASDWFSRVLQVAEACDAEVSGTGSRTPVC